MEKSITISSSQQRLGRRLGLTPYYRIATQEPNLLQLESYPEANRGMGLAVLAGGITLILLALVVGLSGLSSAAAGSGFAVAALAAVIAAALAGLGYQRVVGGYAVLTTRNSIIANSEAADLSFRQHSAVGGERIQVLSFAQISGLRLRRRPLATGWPIRRIQPIVALELMVGEQIWVVDTSADPATLQPTALALGELLGRTAINSDGSSPAGN